MFVPIMGREFFKCTLSMSPFFTRIVGAGTDFSFDRDVQGIRSERSYMCFDPVSNYWHDSGAYWDPVTNEVRPDASFESFACMPYGTEYP